MSAPASPAKTECEDDEFDTYWNNRVGEHEVWVPFYEDYVQFWKLGDVTTDEDGRDWVLDKHREVYVPIPRATAAWLRTIRKARYGEREAGKNASMSPETDWGTPLPDEDMASRFQAWTASPVAAPTNASRHIAAYSAAARSHGDGDASEYDEDESSDGSSDKLEYVNDQLGVTAHKTSEYPRYAHEDCGYSDDDGSEYASDACEDAEDGFESGYASDRQHSVDEAAEEYAARTVTYEFEIKVEEDDDDYALLHPDSPRPDAEVDAITELMRELGLPDGDALLLPDSPRPDSPRPDEEVDAITALMRELGLTDGDAPADGNDNA